MGLEDRDYYRENYAKKHGMRYNARNATYADDPEPEYRRSPPRKPPGVVVDDVYRTPPTPIGADWHWSLKFALWLLISLLVLLIVRFVNAHA